MSYYERDLAFIHDRGYGLHADRCAPGILELLSGVGDGLVLELGCGSGGRGTPGRPALGDRSQGLIPNGPGACPGLR